MTDPKQILSVAVGPSMVSPMPFTTRPEIDGTFGAVASTHWIATAVGMSMLERGGNAFDAACAVAFTLQVVEPHLNGPGGDVPVVLYDTRRGRPEVICGQGPAPAAASIAAFHGLGLDMVPGSGLLAACVPGTFETWAMLLRDFGTLRLRDVLEPAIHYARNGQPLLERAVETITMVQELFRKHWPTSAAVWLPNGELPKPGVLFSNPTLANTYERILKEAETVSGREQQIERARAQWSKGFVAEAIDKFCRDTEAMDTSGAPHRGLLTGADMAAWSPRLESPVTYQYGPLTVCKAGFWSQGPVLLQQLALLKGFPFDSFAPTDPDFIHYQVECAKLAFADRDTFYGDPDFVAVPGKELLSDAYNDARRALISQTASLELRPGRLEGFGGTLRVGKGKADSRLGGGEPTVGALGGGEPTVGRLGSVVGDTVHFDIVDKAGNMISATPSGGWLQSSPTIPSLGFCLGTRAQMFWLDEKHPAALVPGKRPRSTLSPTLAMRDGEPFIAWGSPGGDQQDQWICQFLLRIAHAGHNLQQAIDAPAWHTEHFPASFWPRAARPGVVVVENRVGDATIAELRRRGHIVEVSGAWTEGRLTAVKREGVRRKAAANPRGMQGYAAGR